MSMSMSTMLLFCLRSSVRRRSPPVTQLPPDTAQARARTLWVSHFRIEKELLGNRLNIFKADVKSKTNVNSKSQPQRAHEQLYAHVQLAQQFCQVSDSLYSILDSIRSKDPAFTPCIHPLYDAVEVLNYYYNDTSEVNKHLCTQWFVTKQDLKFLQHWRELQKDVKEKAERLEAFLSPYKPLLMADDGKVPLESLFELSIQCYLDCIMNREPDQVGIGTDVP